MDGVLSDFKGRYFQLFGEVPKSMNREHYNTLVDYEHFMSLDKAPGANDLIAFLESIPNIQLCVLSSSGGFERHSEVQTQKIKWLCANGIKWPAVVVPGRKFKSGFASGGAFMIDDTPDVIKGFCENTGNGIVHIDVEHTIRVITKWLVVK